MPKDKKTKIRTPVKINKIKKTKEKKESIQSKLKRLEHYEKLIEQIKDLLFGSNPVFFGLLMGGNVRSDENILSKIIKLQEKLDLYIEQDKRLWKLTRIVAGEQKLKSNIPMEVEDGN